MFIIGRIAITSWPSSSCTTHGRLTSAYVPRMPACGWLMIGVPWKRAEPARVRDRERAALDVVGHQLLRARLLGQLGRCRAPCREVQVLRVRMTGTIRPFPSSSATAMPRFTNVRVSILSPRISPLTHGHSASVSTAAFEMNAR
jgi:hypothetical protein